MSTSRYDAKRWKAITHNYDEIASPNEETTMVCLTETELQVLIVLTEYLEWPTRYYSPTNQPIDRATVLNFAEELRCKLMCDCAGGSAAYCACNTNILINQLYQLQLQQADTGSVSSYAPQAPDTTYSSDSGDTTPELQMQRSDALCLAVSSYVDTILNELKTKAAALGLVTGAVGAVTAVSLPMAGLIITFIGSAVAGMLEAIANDEQAVEDVKCCMLQGLTGQEITLENFAAALGGCGFDFGSGSAQLSAMVNSYNQEIANFRAFNVALGQAMPSASLADCECEDQLIFDFTVDQYGFVIPPAAGEAINGFGDYVVDTGFVSEVGNNGYYFAAANRTVRIKNVTKVRLYLDAAATTVNFGLNGSIGVTPTYHDTPEVYYEYVFAEPLDVTYFNWYVDHLGLGNTVHRLEFDVLTV